MKFSIASIIGVLATAVYAKVAFSNTNFDVQEGVPFNLTWIGATGPVTVSLVTGTDPLALKPVKDIGTGLTGGSLLFTPSGLKSGSYAFRITDSADPGNPNYSVLFKYTGTGSSTSSSETSTTTSATTSSSSSTSASTTTTGSSTTTKSSSTTASTTKTTPTGAPTNNNEGQRFSSPLALVLITVAALVFLN